jgi:hypothetical protein
MSPIDEAAILKRAKELCEKNGTAWNVEFAPARPGAPYRLVIDEVGRREYLARARKELDKECDGGE